MTSNRERFRAERATNEALNRVVSVGINTHVPSKYRLIDLETGDVWMMVEDPDIGGDWRRAPDQKLWADVITLSDGKDPGRVN